MKAFLLISLLFASGVFAQQNPPVVALAVKDGKPFPIWISAASDRAIRYTETARGTVYREALVKSLDGLYFQMPVAFQEGLELFRGHKFEEAKAKFTAAAEAHRIVKDFPGNWSILASFYLMECSRLLMELDELQAQMDKFDDETLLRENHKKQIEINRYWDAIRSESWTRLLTIAEAEIETPLPGYQRVQLAYLAGLANEKLGNTRDSLTFYNKAMTADFGASDVYSIQAALNAFSLLKENPDVQVAIRLFGTDEFEEASEGAILLEEAVALVKVWDKAIGVGKELPSQFREFSKYEIKEETAAEGS